MNGFDRIGPAHAVTEQLMRHQQRRSSSIPTLTVLAGPVGLSVCAWKRWASENRRPVAIVEDHAPGQIVDAWLRKFAEHQQPVVAVAQYLSRRAGRSVQQVLEALSSKTDYELNLMLDVCDLDHEHASAGRLCREVIQAHRTGTPLNGWSERLTMSRMATGETLVAVARGLLIVAGPERVPFLLARRPASAEPGEWIASIAPLFTEAAIALPQLALALAVEVVELKDFFGTPPESRAKAMLREGVVEVRGHDDTAIRQRLESGGGLPSGQATAAIRRLAADGASDELVDLFAAALRATGGSTDSEEDQRARSAAELFLYERLESHPQTTGAFELNGKLDLSPDFQSQAEIDLLARDLKLAIEIDGYFHFQDESAYRRDRRKDLGLQKHGYLVLRCLADDIVARFEEILDAILDAVRFLRNRMENLAEKEP